MLYPIILAFSLFVAALFPMESAFAVPTLDELQSQRDDLAKVKDPTPDQQDVLDALQGAIKFLQARDDTLKQIDALRDSVQQAPKLLQAAHQSMEQLQSQAPTDINQKYGKMSAEQLDQVQTQRSTTAAQWQKDLSEVSANLLSVQTQPERAQADLTSNQARLQAISQLLGGISKDNAGAKVAQLQAEQAMLMARNDLLSQQLAVNAQLQELASAQREVLTQKVAQMDKENIVLQQLVNDKRRESSEQTVAQLAVDTDSNSAGNALLNAESESNRKISDILLRTTDQLNSFNQRNLHIRQQLDSLAQSEQALQEQISALRGSLLLSRIISGQMADLREVKEDKKLPNEIAEIRLSQFELNESRRHLSNPQSYVDGLIGQQSDPVPADVRSKLQELVSQRLELTDQLSRELSAELSAAITLQLNQQQLLATTSKLHRTLNEQIFWLPSNRPMTYTWLKHVPERIKQQTQEMHWDTVFAQMLEGLFSKLTIFIPLVLVIIAALAGRNFMKRKLGQLNREVGHFRKDDQMHTPSAILLNLLLALPLALFFALCGLALHIDGRGPNVFIGDAFLRLATASLFFYTTYRLLQPDGVAEAHFHWPRPLVRFLHVQMMRMCIVMIPLIIAVPMAKTQFESATPDTIGQILLLIGYVLMAALLIRMLLVGPVRDLMTPMRMLLALCVIALPIALAVGMVMGYYYAAVRLSERLIETLYIFIIWVLIEACVIRGLNVAARRLAYQRALAKQGQSSADNESDEEPMLDIDEVNDQSLRLIRLLLVTLLLVALYWAWADLIPVFSYLREITVYTYTSGTGTGATQLPINLGDILVALAMIVVTLVLGSNLPGLLEIAILSRLSLAQGSAYATTTLLSYVIYGVGFVSALSTLGVSWDKLQWLVAALSVGLGFGLQEIFGNFISGLIILFERPVRIGDTVTIGSLSGTVSKIRIRATTLTEGDAKEIIVPNKTFITSQLINWTLSSTITRVTIHIGVAYGSDLDKVRELLLQAALANPRVLRDPPPSVLFLTFADSTLNHELRMHVREIYDRNRAIDEVNRAILKGFEANGIEIAFPQMDLHIRDVPDSA